MKKRIRLQGMLMLASLLVLLLLSQRLMQKWQSKLLDEVFDTLGMVMVFGGLLLRMVARGYKEALSQQGQVLVADGPYAYVRNPMYLGTFLIGLGINSMFFQWWVTWVFAGIYLLIYIPQIREEETMLSRKFGAAYQKYQKQTAIFLPHFKMWFAAKKARKLMFHGLWIKKELPSLLLVTLLLIGVEAWEDIRLYGAVSFTEEAFELLIILAGFIFIMLRIYAFKGRAGRV